MTQFAVGHHAAAMQLDQPLHQRQADTESALRPVERTFGLCEQLKAMRQQIGRNANAVVSRSAMVSLSTVSLAATSGVMASSRCCCWGLSAVRRRKPQIDSDFGQTGLIWLQVVGRAGGRKVLRNSKDSGFHLSNWPLALSVRAQLTI